MGPLGLGFSLPRKGALDCAKVLKKCGRKSLQELRSKDGVEKGQVKLTDILYAWKGEILPIAPWISLHGILGASMPLTNNDS